MNLSVLLWGIPQAMRAAAREGSGSRSVGSPVQLLKDPRWRRNTIVGRQWIVGVGNSSTTMFSGGPGW